MRIALVSTVFNDHKGITRFLKAVANQTRFPDEIVVVDAGSKDGTWELMLEEQSRRDRPWQFRALREERCNVARGRDIAIDAALADIIVSTDIGCEWDPLWLAELVGPLFSDAAAHLVNGSWAVGKEELEGHWALTEWALKGDHRFVAEATSHSSSRSIAYRKDCWKALGGYPEDLTLAADDAVFAMLVEKAEVPRVGAPLIRCWWHRHSTLQGFFKEAFRYGLGDGEAGIRKADVFLIGGRMAMEASAVLLGAIGCLSGLPGTPWVGLAFLAGAAASIGVKILKLRGAITRLRGEGVSHPLLRLLAFIYGTKWHWLRGYFKGVRRGRIHCQDCRRRLREMTPELYWSRLSDLPPAP